MKTIQKLMVLLVLTGICTAQPVSSDGEPAAKKSKAHHAAKKAETAASAEEVRQLKEVLKAQQAELDALKQQMSQHDQQTQQAVTDAQKAATDAQRNAAEAQTKVATVESSSTETRTNLEKVQADMSDVRTTLTNTADTTQQEQKRVGLVEATLGRFRWSGDVRFRYENFFQNATPDRHRFRIRLRAGAEGKLNEDFVGGFFLASGDPADPTSTNQTLGDNWSRKPINIDRAYLTFNPSSYKWFSVTGGKWAYSWIRTNPTFDPDINPEGITEKVSLKLRNPIAKELNFTGMQLILRENNSGAAPRTDSWVYGGAVSSKLVFGPWTMVPSYSLLNFHKPQLSILSASGTLVGSAAAAFAPNGMTNALCSAGTGATTFCSQYMYSDIIVSNVIKTGIAKLPFNWLAEYEQNLNSNASAKDHRKHDQLLYGEVGFGQLKNKGDMQFGYTYTRSEQDAVLASFSESDQRSPTNTLQHKLFFSYKVRPNTVFSYTQWIGRYLDPNLISATSNPATANPWLKRGQFDLMYSF